MIPKLPSLLTLQCTDISKEQFLFEVSRALGIKTAAAQVFLEHALENVLLMDAKQLDYGSRNITKGGTFGCVLRASDKFERLFNLFTKKRNRPVNESVQDSFRDISNYMVIAIMLEKGEWPKE